MGEYEFHQDGIDEYRIWHEDTEIGSCRKTWRDVPLEDGTKRRRSLKGWLAFGGQGDGMSVYRTRVEAAKAIRGLPAGKSKERTYR